MIGLSASVIPHSFVSKRYTATLARQCSRPSIAIKRWRGGRQRHCTREKIDHLSTIYSSKFCHIKEEEYLVSSQKRGQVQFQFVFVFSCLLFSCLFVFFFFLPKKKMLHVTFFFKYQQYPRAFAEFIQTSNNHCSFKIFPPF